jgi:lysozyme family protein
MSRFDDVFERVIGHEGGYVNNPKDPGGETKYGISKRSYPNLDIAGLTLEDAKGIYRLDFWGPLRCEELPRPVDEFLFDFGVNSGVMRASKALQEAAGVQQDGKIGPRTLAAVKSKDPLSIVRLLFVERALVFSRQREVSVFGRGWFGRLYDVTSQAISDKGVS